MKVLIFINGEPGGAEALRAEAFASRVPADWVVRLAYRSGNKVAGVARFCREAIAFRPNVIYVMKCAFTGVVAAAALRGVAAIRFLCDTGDAVYELARSMGTYSRLQMALVRATEYAGLHAASGVVVRGSFHKTMLQQQGIGRVTFIPDGVAVTRLGPIDHNGEIAKLRQTLRLEGRFVAGIVGTMTWSTRHRMGYGWDLVEAIALLPDVPVDVLLVGDGDGRARLEARARELGICERVRFVGNQPYDRLAVYLGVMDACVSTQSADVVGNVRTTGKLPLYLAHGKHVISTDVGEAHRVLPGVGSLLPYKGIRDDQHPARLANEIRVLYESPGRRCSPAAARAVASREFDYDLLAARFVAACESAVSSPLRG